jgi:hypothetical protein
MGRLAWLRVTIIMLIANFNFADLVSTRALRSDSGFEVTPSRPKQDPRKICRVVPRSPRETKLDPNKTGVEQTNKESKVYLLDLFLFSTVP